jgi:hypothetical protein
MPVAQFRADLKVSATTAGTSPGLDGNAARPFTYEQVASMVRDGFGDESGAKLIAQRGIDFAPAEDFLQTLKAAGASEAFNGSTGGRWRSSWNPRLGVMQSEGRR